MTKLKIENLFCVTFRIPPSPLPRFPPSAPEPAPSSAGTACVPSAAPSAWVWTPAAPEAPAAPAPSPAAAGGGVSLAAAADVAPANAPWKRPALIYGPSSGDRPGAPGGDPAPTEAG